MTTMRSEIQTCPGCQCPAHATETDDENYHPECRPDIADDYDQEDEDDGYLGETDDMYDSDYEDCP